MNHIKHAQTGVLILRALTGKYLGNSSAFTQPGGKGCLIFATAMEAGVSPSVFPSIGSPDNTANLNAQRGANGLQNQQGLFPLRKALRAKGLSCNALQTALNVFKKSGATGVRTLVAGWNAKATGSVGTSGTTQRGSSAPSATSGTTQRYGGYTSY